MEVTLQWVDCVCKSKHEMDIEGPHKPIKSLREFFLHLLTITVGIVIALTLEAIVQRHHEHALVLEAARSLDAEIATNETRVIKHRDELAKLIGELSRLQAQVKSRRAGASWSSVNMEIHPPVTLLSGAAWDAASATQSVSLMGFEAAQQYAPIYAMQRTFVIYQDRSLDLWLDALSAAADGKQTSSSELAAADHKLESAILRAKAFVALDDEMIKLVHGASPGPRTFR